MTGTVAKAPIQKNANPPSSTPMAFLQKMNPVNLMGPAKKLTLKPKSEWDMEPTYAVLPKLDAADF